MADNALLSCQADLRQDEDLRPINVTPDGYPHSFRAGMSDYQLVSLP